MALAGISGKREHARSQGCLQRDVGDGDVDGEEEGKRDEDEIFLERQFRKMEMPTGKQ